MINRNIFRMIRYFFRCKKATACAIIMCILGLAVGIVTPICNKLLQEEIIPNKNISLFVWLTLVILILNLVSSLTSFFTTRIFINNGIPITSNIRKDIIKMNVFSKKNTANKGRVLISSTVFLEDGNTYYISYMYLIFDCILKFLFYLPFFIFYGRNLSLIMLAAAIVGFIFIDVADYFCRKCMHKSRIYDAERYEYTLKMARAMRSPNFKENENLNLDTYMKKVRAFDKAWLSYCNWANMYPYIFNLIWYIGLGVCFCLSFGMIQTGVLSISILILFNSYVDQLKTPLSNFSSYKVMAVRYEETFKNTFSMLDDADLKSLRRKPD